jgi:hypothetical protein
MSTKPKPPPPFHLRLAIPFDLKRDDDREFVEAMDDLPNGAKTAVVRKMLMAAFASVSQQPGGMAQLMQAAMQEQKQRGRERGRPAFRREYSKAVRLEQARAVGSASTDKLPEIKVDLEPAVAPQVQLPKKMPPQPLAEQEPPSAVPKAAQGKSRYNLGDFSGLG